VEKRDGEDKGGGTVLTMSSAQSEEGWRRFVQLKAPTDFSGNRPGGGDSDREMVETGGEGGGEGGGGGGGGYRGGNRRGRVCGRHMAAGSGGSSALLGLGEERKGKRVREGNGTGERRA
jgi:hypothetical protein